VDDKDKYVYNFIVSRPFSENRFQSNCKKILKSSRAEKIFWKEKSVFPLTVLWTEFMYMLQSSEQDLFMHYLI